MPISFQLPRPKFFDKLAKAKGPLAFVDESFQAPSQWPDSFYILAAAVIDKDKILEVRKELRRRAGSSTWHTTESGRNQKGQQKIRELASYLATVCKPVVLVIEELSPNDRSAEAGRAQAIRALLIELAQEHMYLTGTVVYEKRIPGYMQSHDELILEGIRKGKNPAEQLNVLGISTKREPLLWAPDIICWAFRQAYLDDDTSYFAELSKVAKVISVSGPGQKLLQSH